MEIAIVGVGKVAQDNYIPTLLRHKDVSLTCYSRTVEKTQTVAQKFGLRAARTLEELFERQPEAVFVLTHVEQHLESIQSLFPF
ncbi:MAG TPA: Gfo/Idh/MocA family oxidoreductase, partial [Anaerolineales bacterium]|nr:Gfo/Idh/MocA family oxidoreductase [Anaerolineales bacterium]